MSILVRSATSPTGALEALLQRFGPLKPADLDVLRACCDDLRTAHAGSGILGSLDGHPRLIVSGWGAAVRSLMDGRRQILEVFLPGNVVGLSARGFEGDTIALTNVASTDARPLAEALKARDPAHAGLHAAWERAQSDGQGRLFDHIVRLGRMSAHERTAHLLLELMDRHRRADLSDGRRMPWPLTQETLADILGLSVVHVNRILQQLRGEGLIALRGGQLVLPDVDGLALLAGWQA